MQFFREILDNYLIRNFPCTEEDDKLVFGMHRLEVHAIRSRDLRKPQQVLPRLEIVEVEENIKAPYKQVRLFADIFWYMGLPFVHYTSENICFRTSALIPNRESQSLKKALTSVFDAYTNNNFNVKTLDADLEFEFLRNILLTKVNVVYKDSHVHPA